VLECRFIPGFIRFTPPARSVPAKSFLRRTDATFLPEITNRACEKGKRILRGRLDDERSLKDFFTRKISG
jgi:hypothetical protein